MNKWIMFILGFLLVSLGIAMVLQNWEILAAMVKASVGVIIALIGIVMMFAASFKR